MLSEFTAVYEPQENGWIRAYALEVPGSRSYGRTMEEARANLAEFLRLTLNSYRLNLLKQADKTATIETIRIDLPLLPRGVDEALAVATGLKTRSFTQQEFKQALLDQGLLSEIPPPPSARREERELIVIEGKPISEEIIEGRR